MSIELIVIWYFFCSFLSYGIIFGDVINDELLFADCKGDERMRLLACRVIAFSASIFGPLSLLRAMITTRCKHGLRWGL
jgi:hypothetical protein